MHAAHTAGLKQLRDRHGSSSPRRPAVRWIVRCYAINRLALSCGIPAAPILLSSEVFRWRWLAQLWRLLKWCPPHFGFAFWSDIERQRPQLRVIEGGGEYAPRGVA